MPFLTRNRRRWIAVSAVTLVAFTHAALAVSGCLSSTMPASEAGCEEHQQAASNQLLCRTHLQAETQTLDVFKLPQLPSLEVAFDGAVEPFVQNVLAQHYILSYGDNRAALKELCAILRVPCIE